MKFFGEVSCWGNSGGRRGHDLELGYPFVVAALAEGCWHEAADLYKEWATARSSFRADFNQNLEVIRKNGDYVAPFCAYGTMLRQPPIEEEVAAIEVPFWHYADINGLKNYRKGVFRAPELLWEAWRTPDGRVGLFLVNLRTEAALEVRINKKELAALYGLGDESRLGRRYPRTTEDPMLKEMRDSWSLNLPSRHFVFLEVDWCLAHSVAAHPWSRNTANIVDEI